MVSRILRDEQTSQLSLYVIKTQYIEIPKQFMRKNIPNSQNYEWENRIAKHKQKNDYNEL